MVLATPIYCAYCWFTALARLMLAVPLPCQHADHILQLPYPGQQLLLITAAAAMHLTSCTIATRRRHRRGPRRMPDLVHGLPHGLVQVSSMHCVSVAVRLGRERDS